MSLKRWLAEGRIRRHRTTYNAILQLATIILLLNGFEQRGRVTTP